MAAGTQPEGRVMGWGQWACAELENAGPASGGLLSRPIQQPVVAMWEYAPVSPDLLIFHYKPEVWIMT